MDMATSRRRRRARRPTVTRNSGGSGKRRKIGIEFKKDVDSSPPPHLCGVPRRGNDASSSEVEEELEEKDMDSAMASLSELRSTGGHGLQPFPKVEAPENRKPTKSEIEDFFAVAEAENLQYFKKKYNFDFAKEESLEGRFQWRQYEEDKCR